ncbi:MAG: nitrate transporter permease [Acidimicrobiales bacterium]|nr:nitrate transporter permease [Acidimicrobiales bacterium]
MRDADAPRPLTTVIASVVGSVAIVALWQVVGATEVFGSSISPPSKILDVFLHSQDSGLIQKAALVTGSEALDGFLWGLLLAAIVGVVVVVVPVLRRGVDQLATIQSAIPFVALAPILLANFTREEIPSAMATATVFFTIYVAMVAGLQSASATLHDVVAVFGSSRRQRLLRVQIPAAIPVLATGLKVAMPLAIVGAVIGEWFGVSNGIGPVLLISLRDYEMPKMWAAASATVVVALVLFGVMAFIERIATDRFGGAS